MQIIANSPAAAHLLDVTRTVSRAGQRATGIDRIERAYIAHLAAVPTPLFGLVRTKLGFLLLDREGCTRLLSHCETPLWSDADALSRLTRRSDPPRAVTETGLRKMAVGRSIPSRLGTLLQRHLPAGSVYLNVGQTDFNDTVIYGVRSAGAKIVAYLHDTIPLDWPETQTPTARLRFRRFLERVERVADLVLCNSADTRAHLLGHAQQLQPGNVHVIHPGLPEIAPGRAPEGPWTGQPYFIAVGTIEPRKNIGFLLDLWSDLSGTNGPHLVLCGRPGWMCGEVMERIDSGIPRVHHLPALSDPALWALMASGRGLLFPSLAEGFGYPAIEAAHLGIPILCTPLPAFRELLGDYPIYASASDRYLWRNKIEQLAQRRQDRSGEQKRPAAFEPPTWPDHFNRLFTCL